MPIITVQLATDEILSQFYEFHTFTDSRARYGQKIIITTDRDLHNFRFVEVFFDYYAQLRVGAATLYSIDKLTPEMPFVTTLVGWWMAQRGISFTCEFGQTISFILSHHNDDSIVLRRNFFNIRGR